MCCGTTTGLRISTILALLTSLTLTIYSAYLFQGHYQDKYSQSTRALDAVTGIVNKSLTTELNIKLVQFFLGGCGLDLLILIYASCVAGVFLRN